MFLLNKKSKNLIKKPAVLLLVFLFLLQPIFSVFAEENTVIEGNLETSVNPTIQNDSTNNIQDLKTEIGKQKINEKIGQEDISKTTEEIIDPSLRKNQTPSTNMENQSLVSGDNIQTAFSNTYRTNSPQTDASTGALVYSYNFSIPSGRNGIQPNISAEYNSQNLYDGGITGYGWNINIPYIQRKNVHGTNSLYTNNDFISSQDGDLINSSGSLYVPKIDNGNFMQFTFSSNTWIVKDKKGITYTYGMTAQARQDNPSDTTKIYKWMLEKVEDTNGNFVSFSYYKDQGQIYPDTITYTNTPGVNGPFTVLFLRESRPDAVFSYQTGFKVTTNYRVSSIQTKINQTLVREYAFTYALGVNGGRSLLSSITESGTDTLGVKTTLPATVFSYQNNATPTWDFQQYILPDSPDQYTTFIDINGDSWNDLIYSKDVYTAGCGCFLTQTSVYLNGGDNTTWIPNTTYLPPMDLYKHETRGGSYTGFWDQGVRFVDVNGDKLLDLVQKKQQSQGQNPIVNTYLNTGSGWNQSTLWNSSVYLESASYAGSYPHGYPARAVDLNGDDLIDLTNDYESTYSETQLNNGTDFLPVSQSIWNRPINSFSYSHPGYLNTDTLPDTFTNTWNPATNTFETKTFLNNGTDINTQNTQNFASPYPIYSNSGYYNCVTYYDINNDGITDTVSDPDYTQYFGCVTPLNTFINNGTNFTQNTNWNLPDAPYNTSYGEPIFLTDVNSDGLLDRAGFKTNNQSPLYVINSNNQANPYPDLLSNVSFSTGGSTTITYKPSSQYKNTSGNLLNPKLPFIVQTVNTITKNDGSGTVGTQTYSYEGGVYYFNNAFDRKFAGFEKVTETDAVGNKTITFFHQGNTTNSSLGEYDDQASKIGKPYRIEMYDSAGNLYQKTINKWDRYTLISGSDFVKLTHSTSEVYDGNSTHKDTTQEYVYDNTYGNLTQKVSWGEVVGADDGSFTDTGTDKATENISYVANTGNYVVGLPYQDVVTDQGGTKVSEVKTYYDNLGFGSVAVGNPTKTEQWKSGTSYISSQKSYNSYGLVVSDTDPRGKITSYIYDSYNLYPATMTDPLGHTTSYLYNYSIGKPTQVTDQNNFVYKTIFDGLGRTLEEKVPDTASPYTPITKTLYVYTDTSNAVSVKSTQYLDATNIVDSYQYFDGLGRVIQERKEAEVVGNFNVRDFAYDSRGLLQKESVPYTSAGATKTTPATNASLYTTYTYDTLQRILSRVNTLGVTNYAYDDWKTTITDANNKIKKYYKDAYDNLTQVDEINSGATYSTSYLWDLNKKLLKITDALGNVRNFTYDGLGRRLSAEDLHAPVDTTFGVWNYTYDDAGNITLVSMPIGQTITKVYDDLNRQTSEDYSGTTGVEMTYVYDTCTNGVGKLCAPSMSNGANTTYTYNSNGAVASESKTINAVVYTTSYTYDRQGNQLVITYPDSSSVKYVYAGNGLVNKIQQKENGGSYSNLISNIDYAPNDAVSFLVYVNGATTTNTYDQNKLYRLTSKVTLKGANNLQNFAYTYDNVGNITRIVDTSNTNGAKQVDYVYDDLYRLTSATATNTANAQNYTQTFTYDAVGNILTGPAGTYTYAGNTGALYANPHAATTIGTTTYVFNKNGNLTSTSGGLVMTNVWNYRDQMTQTTIGATVVSYYYDHEGNRVRYKVGTANTYYPNKYYNINGTKKTRQIYLGDQLVGTSEDNAGVVSMYGVHTDTVLDSNIVTDNAGVKIQLLDYYPFGDIRLNEQNGSFNEQNKFGGHTYDTDSDLNYLGARYYYAKVGKFISQDPSFQEFGDAEKIKSITGIKFEDVLMDPQSFNSYGYARNNPINKVDPDGRWTKGQIEGANYLYNNSSVWRYAMDNPGKSGLAVGASSGLAFVGASVGITVLSTEYLGGAGTACYAFCGKVLDTVQQIQTTPLQIRDAMLDGVQNQKLGNIIKQFYKSSDKIPGGTAGAIKYTQETGQLVGNSNHIKKGYDLIQGLNNVLGQKGLSQSDAIKAEQLLNSLSSALKNVKK